MRPNPHDLARQLYAENLALRELLAAVARELERLAAGEPDSEHQGGCSCAGRSGSGPGSTPASSRDSSSRGVGSTRQDGLILVSFGAIVVEQMTKSGHYFPLQRSVS